MTFLGRKTTMLACSALLAVAGAARTQEGDPNPSVRIQTQPPREPDSDEVRARLAPLFEGALLDTRNGDDFAETPGYRKLHEIVASYGSEEFHKRVTRQLEGQAYADALAHPGDWRGEFVSVRSRVAGMSAVLLDQPIWERKDVYRGVLVDPDDSMTEDTSEAVIVEFLERPPEFELQRSVVDVEGVVYRTVSYETRRGERRTAPYLIARNLKVVDVEQEPRSTQFDTYVLVVLGAAVVWLIYRLWPLLGGRSRPDQPFSAKDALRRRGRRPPDQP